MGQCLSRKRKVDMQPPDATENTPLLADGNSSTGELRDAVDLLGDSIHTEAPMPDTLSQRADLVENAPTSPIERSQSLSRTPKETMPPLAATANTPLPTDSNIECSSTCGLSAAMEPLRNRQPSLSDVPSLGNPPSGLEVIGNPLPCPIGQELEPPQTDEATMSLPASTENTPPLASSATCMSTGDLLSAPELIEDYQVSLFGPPMSKTLHSGSELSEDPLPFSTGWPTGMGPLPPTRFTRLEYANVCDILEGLDPRDITYYGGRADHHYQKLTAFLEAIFARPPNGRTPFGGLRWQVFSPPEYGNMMDDAAYPDFLDEIFGKRLDNALTYRPSTFRRYYLIVFGEHLMQIRCPPWPCEESTTCHFVLHKNTINQEHSALQNLSDAYGPLLSRLYAWFQLELEASGIPEDDLFSADRVGRKFALRPNPQPSIPFQRAHVGARTIPDDLANQQCSSMGIHKLLHMLNDVQGTFIQMSTSGVHECLEYFSSKFIAGDCLTEGKDRFIDGSCSVHSIHSMDFGQAYAHWRTVKDGNFETFIRTLEARRAADEAMRKDAIQDTYISNAQLPPRRVWDVFSNRVIPFYLLADDTHGKILGTIKTVSHSWCHPNNRHAVYTPINSYEWPVPVPKISDSAYNSGNSATATILERVRVELLNFGAEYAWLDVLCIRQKGEEQHEALRVDEWKTDIPMIGRIYNCQLACVVYFNGLGLRLQLDSDTLSSKTHWLNRVWTLQEGTRQWLPGGMTDTVLSSEEAYVFFQRVTQTSMDRDSLTALTSIQKRHCTTELDRVHGLAYVIGCESLPIYDPDMTPNDAWLLLLKHTPARMLSDIALLHMQYNPSSTSLLPSFEELKTYAIDRTNPAWFLIHNRIDRVGKLSQGKNGPDTYIHKVKFLGELSVSQPWPSEGCSPKLDLSFTLEADRYRIYGRYLPAITYSVVSFCLKGSLVIEVLGETVIDGVKALKVAKRGCVHWMTGVLEVWTGDGREVTSIIYVLDTDD